MIGKSICLAGTAVYMLFCFIGPIPCSNEVLPGLPVLSVVELLSGVLFCSFAWCPS